MFCCCCVKGSVNTHQVKLPGDVLQVFTLLPDFQSPVFCSEGGVKSQRSLVDFLLAVLALCIFEALLLGEYVFRLVMAS